MLTVYRIFEDKLLLGLDFFAESANSNMEKESLMTYEIKYEHAH